MNSFVNYIFESGISLGIFSLIYFLLLRNETFFRLNRFFLLAAILFSAVLPILHFRVYAASPVMLPEITVLPYRNILETISVYGNSVSGNVVQVLTTSQWIGLIYLAGVIFFMFLFAVRLLKINQVIRTGKKVTKDGINYVIVDRKVVPFSFLRYVFVSDDFKTQTGWDKILAHEMEHVRQGHSVDVLILEILSVLQWFNPFFWMLKRALKENHEFLADRAVVKNSGKVKDYKQLLLNQLVGEQFVIANNFNYSLVKKRMKMMTKIKSSKVATIKLLSGVLIALALIVVFACEQKENVIPESDLQLKSESNTEPFILIDEEVASSDAMEKLNPNSIKSISVIKEKDHPLMIKYGDLAAGGIISITTKEKAFSAGTESNVKIDEAKGFGEKAFNDVFFIVEEMPEFPGGELALRKFIASSIKYPVEAIEKGIEGKVYVSFIVEKDGSIGRAMVVRGVNALLDIEALRVVSDLPNWKPGRQRGQDVAVQFTVPINFKLK